MVTGVFVFGAISLVSLAMMWHYQPLPERHFPFPLPSDSELFQYQRKRSGFSDYTHFFAFNVSDNTLRDKLIQEWHLEPATRIVSPWPGSPDWWPTPVIPQTLSERYERVDHSSERFYEVRIDSNTGRLYAAYGNW